MCCRFIARLHLELSLCSSSIFIMVPELKTRPAVVLQSVAYKDSEAVLTGPRGVAICSMGCHKVTTSPHHSTKLVNLKYFVLLCRRYHSPQLDYAGQMNKAIIPCVRCAVPQPVTCYAYFLFIQPVISNCTLIPENVYLNMLAKNSFSVEVPND